MLEIVVVIKIRLWPREDFSIKTNKTNDQILQIIQKNTEPERPNIFGAFTDKPFWGNCTADSFTIFPIVPCINSFIPIISGEIAVQADNTIVNVSMQIYPIVSFLVACFMIICAVASLSTIGLIIVKKDFHILEIIPLAMFFFAYGIMYLGFKTETDKVKILLNQLFACP